jgi:hypothetical protein
MNMRLSSLASLDYMEPPKLRLRDALDAADHSAKLACQPCFAGGVSSGQGDEVVPFE